MVLTPELLVDASALARWHEPLARERLEALLLGGRLAICAITMLECGFAVRNGASHALVVGELRAAYHQVPVGEAAFQRALWVQGALAREGRHRAVRLPRLLVAATAELAGLAVLHADADFDRVAEVTGQPCRWVLRRPP